MFVSAPQLLDAGQRNLERLRCHGIVGHLLACNQAGIHGSGGFVRHDFNG